MSREQMSNAVTKISGANWRQQPPLVESSSVRLREPAPADGRAIQRLLSLADSSPFGLALPAEQMSPDDLVAQFHAARASGVAVTFVVDLAGHREPIGVVQFRPQDAAFESAECEMTLAPETRRSGLFLEVIRLGGVFAFDTLGTHRLECRVPMQNARTTGALRKLSAVQEGVLRQSGRTEGSYRN